MANSEIKQDEFEEKKTEELKEEQVNGKVEPEVNQLTEEEAIKMVEEFIKNPDTKDSLVNLKKIEEQYKLNALPPIVKISYENARKNALEQLAKDPIVEQLWINLDNSNGNAEKKTSILNLSDEEAESLVWKILENPKELINQNGNIGYVQENITNLPEKLQNIYVKNVEDWFTNNTDWGDIIKNSNQ